MAVSTSLNERLTRVGPGTPTGTLMRRYWHPILPTAKLDDNPVQKVRLLCEDLVVYRDRSGDLGLIGDRCEHRNVHMEFGIPEQHGLRCPYHGWCYDETGACTETPLEPANSSLKSQIKIKAYPVQEMGGLIWAYLGPQPVPLLPQWDLFVKPGGFRQIIGHNLPCNWLQVMENRGDLGHGTYLHGRLFQYAMERKGLLTDDPNPLYNQSMTRQAERLRRGEHVQYRPITNPFGFTKATLDMDQDESSASWQVGTNPILFPYLLSRGIPPHYGYQIGVPVDDTTTWHIEYMCFVFPDEIELPKQSAAIPYRELPLQDENGEYILDYVLSQDMVAWYSQGEITDRSHEHLAYSDVLVVEYRRLLEEQVDAVERGEEPMNVFWDEKEAYRPELRIPGFEEEPDEEFGYAKARRVTGANVNFARANYHRIGQNGRLYIEDDAERYCPDREVLIQAFRQYELLLQKADGAQ